MWQYIVWSAEVFCWILLPSSSVCNLKRKYRSSRSTRFWCMCDRASYMKMTRGTNWMQQLWFIIINDSTCFGHLIAHLQECRLCAAAYGVQHCKRQLGISGWFILCCSSCCVLVALGYAVCWVQVPQRRETHSWTMPGWSEPSAPCHWPFPASNMTMPVSYKLTYSAQDYTPAP